MKKYLFIAVLAVASLAAYAQPRAIGGRVGAFEGFSYQHGFGGEKASCGSCEINLAVNN